MPYEKITVEQEAVTKSGFLPQNEGVRAAQRYDAASQRMHQTNSMLAMMAVAGIIGVLCFLLSKM